MARGFHRASPIALSAPARRGDLRMSQSTHGSFTSKMKIAIRIAALTLLALLLGPAQAEQAFPNLVGKWSGTAQAVVVGSGGYRPGSRTLEDAAYTDERVFNYSIEGQEGRRFWGRIESGSRTEPFAAAISFDNKTAHGADTNGSFDFTILSADEMELCYTQPGASPSNQIVATCFLIKRILE